MSCCSFAWVLRYLSLLDVLEWNRGQLSIWELRLHAEDKFQREVCMGGLLLYSGWLEGASSFTVYLLVHLLVSVEWFFSESSINIHPAFLLTHTPTHSLLFNVGSYLNWKSYSIRFLHSRQNYWGVNRVIALSLHKGIAVQLGLECRIAYGGPEVLRGQGAFWDQTAPQHVLVLSSFIPLNVPHLLICVTHTVVCL